MATSIYQGIAHRVRRRPFVISPHGMLDPWILSRGRVQKKVASFLYESYAWNNCSFFQALNAEEADAIRSVVPKANVEIIPNAVEFPSDCPDISIDNDGFFKLLYLGRFHEKKNLLSLISAINAIPEKVYRKRPVKLVLAGWGDGKYIKKMKDEIGVIFPNRFEFVGPVFGHEKNKLFRNSSAFILPSLSEGMPMAVLEAWSFGLPVLMSSKCNFSDSFSDGAAIKVSTEMTELSYAIQDFLSKSNSEIVDLGRCGYQFASKNYNWDLVCNKYLELYREVSN